MQRILDSVMWRKQFKLNNKSFKVRKTIPSTFNCKDKSLA